MKAVFLDLKSFINNISLTAIEAQVTDLTCYDVTPPELVVERSINAEVIITNKVVLNRDVMSKLPHLKLICVAATGTNNIDIPAANSLGIKVRWGAAWQIDCIGTWKAQGRSMEDAMTEYVDLRRSQGRRPFIDGPHFELMI